jgi:hypothetical protein
MAASGAQALDFDTTVGGGDETVTVGDVGTPGSFRIMNDAASPVTLTSATLSPACKIFGVPCADEDDMSSQFDPGVVALGASALGRAGDGCAGITFTAGPADANGAQVLTPTPAAPVLAATDGGFGGADTCRIDYTLDVLALPSTDAEPLEPGLQTYSSAEVAFTGTPGGTDTDSSFYTIAPAPQPPPIGGGGAAPAGPTGQQAAALKKCKKKKSKKARKKCKKHAKKLPV